MGSKKHKKHKSDNKSVCDSEDGIQEKPLKLKLHLKVGTGQDGLAGTSSSPVSEERKHKHKKKKKKKSSDRDRERHKYDEEKISLKRRREEDDSDGEEETLQTSNLYSGQIPTCTEEDMEESDGTTSPSRRREPRTCTIRDNDGAILKQMLNYLIKILQNKDVNGFFAFPVTDSIAPGYSSIILNPMDFSTMAAKIEAAEYNNVMEFKKDYMLMCTNAMTYNRPDTIYYREAKRLQQIGIRQLSKEKLLHLKKSHSFLSSITLQELGFDESGHVVESLPAPVTEDLGEKVKEEMKPENEIVKLDAIADDDLSPEEILAQAQEAARSAKNALSMRKPKTDLGFLRLEDDGTTSLTILNPCNDGMVSSTQRVISLGDYMGKLKSGSGSLFRFKEDKRNKVCPETYLCYGPFSSHAPMYDSSFASCTKEESDLLLSTYGGETGVQYAKSVQKFVENAGISAVEMVDKLLDTLTNGQHSKARIIQEQQKRQEEELAEKALQDEMIVKAQKAEEEAEMAEAKDPIQVRLNATAAMLSKLSQTQNQRLSQDLPPHVNFTPNPSDKEADLANKVTNSLVDMAKQVQPGDVVSTQAVRGAMGITTFPVNSEPGSRQSEAGEHSPVARQDASTVPSNKSSDEDSEEDSGEEEDESGDDGNDSGEETGDPGSRELGVVSTDVNDIEDGGWAGSELM